MLVPRATTNDLVRRGKRVAGSHIQLGLHSTREDLTKCQPELRPDTVAYLVVSANCEDEQDPPLFGGALCSTDALRSLVTQRDAEVILSSYSYEWPLELRPGRLIEFSGFWIRLHWEQAQPPEIIQAYDRRFPNRRHTE